MFCVLVMRLGSDSVADLSFLIAGNGYTARSVFRQSYDLNPGLPTQASDFVGP
jgi:hypothetical protein